MTEDLIDFVLLVLLVIVSGRLQCYVVATLLTRAMPVNAKWIVIYSNLFRLGCTSNALKGFEENWLNLNVIRYVYQTVPDGKPWHWNFATETMPVWWSAMLFKALQLCLENLALWIKRVHSEPEGDARIAQKWTEEDRWRERHSQRLLGRLVCTAQLCLEPQGVPQVLQDVGQFYTFVVQSSKFSQISNPIQPDNRTWNEFPSKC